MPNKKKHTTRPDIMGLLAFAGPEDAIRCRCAFQAVELHQKLQAAEAAIDAKAEQEKARREVRRV